MGFIKDIIDGLLYETAKMWADLFSVLGETVFFIENGIGSVISAEFIDGFFSFTISFALSLILLKVLKKGFWTYILWADGDPDLSLQQTVINVIIATVSAITFPEIYKLFASVCLWMTEKLTFTSFDLIKEQAEILSIVQLLSGFGIVAVIATLVYFIMMIVLYLQFIRRSAELLVLRIGFPLACIGLLDSDRGVFSTMIKTFFQVALTTISQLFCMTISISIFYRITSGIGYLLYCIAFCAAAFATPRLLQSIILPAGGGVIQKAGSVLHSASLLRGFTNR